MKREDLSHPFISGNKWRKLKYHLLDAEAQQKNLLVTYGGAYSNHLLATAAAGAKYGFQTHGFVRGEKVQNLPLQLCRTFGMQLQFVSREDYRRKDFLYAQFFGSNPNAYEIAEGGGGALGELGVREIFDNLALQNTPEPNKPLSWDSINHLFTSVGTGSTLRGLLSGVQAKHFTMKLHGIVVLKGAEDMQKDFLEFDSNTYTLHHRFHYGGYAKTNADVATFINKFASQTGILLDQVYEAKMMMGLLTLVQEDYFKAGEQIVALHNGGVMGLSGLTLNNP